MLDAGCRPSKARYVASTRAASRAHPASTAYPLTLAAEASAISALAVDVTNVYWGGATLGLKSMPLAGGSTAVPAACQFPAGIAASGTGVYWTDSSGASEGDGFVMRMTSR